MSEHTAYTPNDGYVPSAKMRALLSSLVEDTLTDDEQTRLETLVATDDHARAFYVDVMSLHAMLVAKGEPAFAEQVGHALRDKQPQPAELARASEGSRACEESEPNAVAPCAATKAGRGSNDNKAAAPTPRKQSLLQWASRHPKGPAIAIAVAVMLMIVGAMAATPVSKWIAGDAKNDAEERQPEGPTASEFVAILNNSQQAKWLEGTQPRLSDPRLKIGRRLAIASGLIEVKYYSGVRVVIEGPAEFVVGRKQGTAAELARKEAGRGSLSRSEDEGGRMKKKGSESEGHPSSFIPHPSNAGYLKLGSLVARVEGEKAQGFTIDTPFARVEDLGTEFGVEVRKNGAAEFVVLSGKVDVVRAADGDRPAERIRLTKDEGAFVAAKGGAIRRRAKVDVELLASMRERIEQNLSGSKYVATPIEPAGSEEEAILIDVDVRAGHTQPGYHSLVVTPDGEGSLALDGLSVQVKATAGRDRGARALGQQQPLKPLLRDLVGTFANEELIVTVSGLAAGEYRFTTYHFDTMPVEKNRDRSFDLLVTDAKRTRWLVARNAVSAMPLNQGAVQNFSVTADGNSDVVIIVTDQGIEGRLGSKFNGMKIVKVEE